MRLNIYRSFRSALTALLIACPAVIRAQDTLTMGHHPHANRCTDQLPPSVFTRVVVYATVRTADSVSRNFATSADNLLQDLVVSAQKLLGAKAETLPEGEPSIDWRVADAMLPITAFPDGRLEAADVPPGSPAALVRRALNDRSALGLLDWSADSARDSITFDIDFVRPSLDSAGHVSKPTLKRAAIPLLSLLTPWERPVTQKHPGSHHPHYPDEANRAGYEAMVLLNFIVDSTGHAVDSTVKELWPSGKQRPTGLDLSMYQQFLEATKRAIPQIEFVPASIGGCLVNELVQMPFVFSLRR